MTPRPKTIRPLRLALNLSLATLLCAGLARGARALAQLPGAAAAGLASIPTGHDRNLPLAGVTVRDVRTKDVVDLAGVRHGLLFVYEPSCVPSGANFWNWAELARDLPGDVRLIALTLQHGKTDPDYWIPLPRVRATEADTTTIRDVLRAPSTPTTLLVVDGRIRREYRGALTTAMRSDLESYLRR